MSLHLKVIDRSRPVCRHLRTKAMHVYGPETGDAFVSSRSSNYQCLRTQQVTGPDDRLCLPESCTPSRECFAAR
ncbi:MAG: hypothetical protein H6710_22820 [Myxococcales bacterium]|nr:hypothetical protein [Myxococcales bacterium]